MTSTNPFLKPRVFQIRILASLMGLLGRSSSGRSLILFVRSRPILRRFVDFLLGYRRAFPSFAKAQASASHYIPASHEHPDEIRFHTSMSETARESDYPVLFCLSRIDQDLRRAFDLGGNVGNLFYCYRQYLNFADDLIWTIYDLPSKKTLGEKLARDRGERRIRYADSIAAASGADLFIASGSLHYFEEPLDYMLSSLGELPEHVIVNRTPCSEGEDIITVQDNRSYLCPCKLPSRTRLIAGMQTLGYELRLSWPIYERKLWVPLYPEYSRSHYSGFYFVKS